jgi:signal transduction histidine kinase
VQESLSNVLQHAPGAAADVVLATDPNGLTITVRNGSAPTAPSANGARRGLGTLGMAERVGALGGTFEAGADDAGGWLVSAWLPVRALAVAGRRG